MKKSLIIMAALFMMGYAANAQSSNSADSATVKCAQAGNDTCQTLLGEWLYAGSHGYKQDYEAAVKWWLLAAKQNNSEATAKLGFCYQFGQGVAADSNTAVRLFEKAMKLGNKSVIGMHDSLARKGNVFSAMFLARCYRMAVVVGRDEAVAIKYYQLAAKRGNVDAMREAAILLRTAKDDAKAIAMFEQAMKKNDVVSTYYYGKMLCEGRGIAADAKSGFTYLLQAAEKGYAAAQYEVAEAYAKGRGVEPDATKTLEWYHKAAIGGNRAAWWQMAECYRLGVGTAIDYEEALLYYAKAWNEGYHNKLTALLTEENSEWKNTPFMDYLRGLRLLELDNNPAAALKEFSKLPKPNSAKQTMEALCLMHPTYAKRNVKKAVKQLAKLADTDHRAAYELALLRMKGEGVEKDIAKSEKELTLLSNAGYSRATNYLADCYYEGNGLQQDKNKAILLYLHVEEQQRLTSNGALRLAQAFRNGEGMKVNESRAQQLEKYKTPNVNNLLEKVR